MKLAIGCDEAAFELKQTIKQYLAEQTEVPVEVQDFGVHMAESLSGKRLREGDSPHFVPAHRPIDASTDKMGTVPDAFRTDSESVDYPDIALQVAKAIARGTFERGILLCGTGLGMAIAANKVPGIRAATCHDVYSAERAQKSNDAQIITLGARVIGPELAKMVVAAWLKSHFAGGGSTRKVEKIMRIEESHRYTVGPSAGESAAPGKVSFPV